MELQLPPRERSHELITRLQSPLSLTMWSQASRVDRPVKSGATTPSGAQTPRIPSDLEASRPSSPLNETDAVGITQSFSNPSMNRFRVLSICLLNFGNGLNDSAPGALIPYIEK